MGVIGPDGTCKVCGRVAPNWGDDRRRGLKTTGELDVKPLGAAPAPEDEDAELDNDEDELGDDEDEDEDEDDDEAVKAVAVDDPGLGEDDGEDDDEDDGDDDSDDAADDDEDDSDDDDDDGDGDAEDPGVVQARAVAETASPKAKAKPRAAGSSEWERRELCSNGACVGVIGDSGTCKTCGARA